MIGLFEIILTNGIRVFFRRENGFEIVEINWKYFLRKMKVDYGEIIFQSTEGITEDQGMVHFENVLAQDYHEIFTRFCKSWKCYISM